MVRSDRQARPSAPPLHLMPESGGGQYVDNHQDWGPPPRYEEAIADENSSPSTIITDSSLNQRSMTTSPIEAAAAAASTTRLPSLISHDQNSVRRNNHHSSRRRNSSHRGSAGNLHGTRTTTGSGGRRSDGLRYRSASPGRTSRDRPASTNESRNDTSDQVDAPWKKHSRRVKKGLESIAYFIIQVLD